MRVCGLNLGVGTMVMGRRNKCYCLAGGVLFAAAFALQVAARTQQRAATCYAHRVYGIIVGVVGGFFGIFPFSVVEMSLYLFVLSCAVYALVNWRDPFCVFCRFFCLAGVLTFLYTCNCGINYYAMPFSGYAGLETGLYSKEELEGLCEFLVMRVNEEAMGASGHAGSLASDGIPASGGESGPGLSGYKGSREEWRRESVRAMQALGRQFPVLGGFYPRPKEVVISWILSVQQLSGIYSPFTVEANFNGDMPDYNIPHTMCHELSHLKGFMREDEANFIGYLACAGSDSQAFRYSAYLTGWVYAGNALAAVDMDAYIRLSGELCTRAQSDLRWNTVFWNQYEGKVAEVSNQMNDAYLKANGREDGVKSYGRMVDLMLAYYAENPY